MNFVTGKHVNRRTLLRGVGAALALPMLEAMRPALGAAAKNASQARRVAVVYVPNGIIMKDWKLAETGQSFAFTRILKPLERFREDITVLSGLANHAAEKARGGGHAKATGSFLSGAEPKYTAGPDVRAGVTFDQLAAQRWAPETRVASLQIGCEDSRMVGNCDTGSSCAYTNSLSWKNPETPLPVVRAPKRPKGINNRGNGSGRESERPIVVRKRVTTVERRGLTGKHGCCKREGEPLGRNSRYGRRGAYRSPE